MDNVDLPPFVESLMKSADALVFPSIGAQLIALYNKPVETKQICDLILSDPGLSATVLKSVNAASTPVAKEITSVERAVNLLGASKSFALAFTHVVGTTTRSIAASVKATSFLEIWRRSLLMAVLSEEINKQEQCGVDNAYIIGLLANIGMVFFLESYSSYSGLVRNSDANRESLLKKEVEKYGVNHVVVGHWVLNRWGFPKEILDALDPSEGNSPAVKQILVKAARLANLCMLHDNNAQGLGFSVSDIQFLQKMAPPANIDADFQEWFGGLKESVVDRYTDDYIEKVRFEMKK